MKRVGKVWAFFVLCGLVGALSSQLLADPSDTSSTETAAQPTSSQPAPAAASAVERLKAQAGETSILARATSALGMAVFVGVCWLISSDRKRINWRLVAWGLGLQLAFGILILKTQPGLWLFERLNEGAVALLGFTQAGTDFLFGSFVSGKVEAPLVNFTFHVLPTIIFFSSLMTVGYHVGIMQRVVNAFAIVMQKTMRCSGAETLSTAANIFVGQTEAPLVVKPYLEKMTRSELHAVMAGGFANTAGGVLAAYVGMLHSHFPDIAGHLIAQSVMSAPAALACAKIAMPETDQPETSAHVKMSDEKIDANVIDAASRGATEGLHLAFNVAAMLLAFIALIAMLNFILTKSAAAIGFSGITLEGALGVLCWPVAWIMGVPAVDCLSIGKLIGIKTVLNEFVAYLKMADMLAKGEPLSYRSVVIASYALSGFANFSSIAIQIGGISALAPTRRHDLAKLGLKAMVVGAIATFMTATVAGMLVG